MFIYQIVNCSSAGNSFIMKFPSTLPSRSSFYICKGKGKVIPVQAVEALRVARGWGSCIFRHSAHRWQQGCQPYVPVTFYPQEDSWYSFPLEAGWVYPRAIMRLEVLGKLKKSTSSGSRTGDLPACSIVPQPTVLPRASISHRYHTEIHVAPKYAAPWLGTGF
jgi:hypothetical protein